MYGKMWKVLKSRIVGHAAKMDSLFRAFCEIMFLTKEATKNLTIKLFGKLIERVTYEKLLRNQTFKQIPDGKNTIQCLLGQHSFLNESCSVKHVAMMRRARSQFWNFLQITVCMWILKHKNDFLQIGHIFEAGLELPPPAGAAWDAATVWPWDVVSGNNDLDLGYGDIEYNTYKSPEQM